MSSGKPRTAITPDSGLTITLRFPSLPTIADSVSRSSFQKSLSFCVSMRLLCVTAPADWPFADDVAGALEVLPLDGDMLDEIDPEVTRMSVAPRRLPAR